MRDSFTFRHSCFDFFGLAPGTAFANAAVTFASIDVDRTAFVTSEMSLGMLERVRQPGQSRASSAS